jgi:broad-specificity NMP kinase
LTDVSEVLTASIIDLILEAVITSETSVIFYRTTRRNIPEDIVKSLLSVIDDVFPSDENVTTAVVWRQ